MATKNRQHLVRMTEEEYATLAALAAKYGYRSSTATSERPGIARYLIDRGLADGGPALTEQDRLIYHRLTWELRKVGININQIAKVLNQGGSIQADSIERVAHSLEQILTRLEEAT